MVKISKFGGWGWGEGGRRMVLYYVKTSIVFYSFLALHKAV
jgi:hypothetical protein